MPSSGDSWRPVLAVGCAERIKLHQACKDIAQFLLVFIIYSMELTINDAKSQRVYEVGHLE